MRRIACVRVAMVMLGALLGACAALPPGWEQPRISISDVTVKDAKLFEQVYNLELRVQNPNDLDLAVNGLTFDLELNGKSFASGVSDHRLTVGRLSSGVVRVEAITTLVGFIRQIIGLAKANRVAVDYRIRGTLYVGAPSFKLPFDDSGSIDFPIPSQQ
jgi:LEA14-like dessication related protein